MARSFNVTGACDLKRHYMVDIQDKLEQIRKLVDNGDYFTINRARQYGKTTTIRALTKYLATDYIVISLDFQRLGEEEFQSATIFAKAFVRYLLQKIRNSKMPVPGLKHNVLEQMEQEAQKDEWFSLGKLFEHLHTMCLTAEKPVVLIIDEVDSATNNQVFLDFLSQLRSDYLEKEETGAFHSVILAGVYDVKNMRRKIRSEEQHKVNSPWNIAADFLVSMSFSQDGIAGMLEQYEADYQTGMNIKELATMIYEYTSGYPYLVSRICKLLEEQIVGSANFSDRTAAWTRAGLIEAVKMLIGEKNTLFESLTGKLISYPELKQMLSAILFEGKDIPFVATNALIELATMFGFVKNHHNAVMVSNRIFESVLYNHLLSEETMESRVYDVALYADF